MKDTKQKIENRQFSNKMILDEIGVFIQKHPDMRFHQILQSMRINQAKIADGLVVGLHDLFNEEPDDTLARIYEFKSSWDSTPPQSQSKGKYPQSKMDFQ